MLCQDSITCPFSGSPAPTQCSRDSGGRSESSFWATGRTSCLYAVGGEQSTVMGWWCSMLMMLSARNAPRSSKMKRAAPQFQAPKKDQAALAHPTLFVSNCCEFEFIQVLKYLALISSSRVGLAAVSASVCRLECEPEDTTRSCVVPSLEVLMFPM